jgi:hypothetical protein
VSEEFRKEFEKILKEFEDRVKKLISDVEGLLDRGEVREAYRLWRERSRDILRELRKIAEGVREGC